jgi:high-affinity Fe2+/Pb2+ permease
MSATPPTDPQGSKDSKDSAKKELNNAILWAGLAAAFAVGMFMYSGKVDPEKKNFYMIAGGIGALVAAFNGYTAFTLSQKAKK